MTRHMSEIYNDFSGVGHVAFALATLMSALAAYTLFSLAVKSAPAQKMRYPWLIAAAVAIGCGAWVADLIMLFQFQRQNVTLDLLPITLALVVCVVGSGIGLFVGRHHDRMQVGGAIVGLSIVAMFYVGMMGVQFPGLKSWDIKYVFLTVVLGASFGAAALARAHLTPDVRGRFLSTGLMSGCIIGTVLAGMASVGHAPGPNVTVVPPSTLPVLLGISLTAVVMTIIGLGVVGTLADRYLDEIEATNQSLGRIADELSGALNAEQCAREELENIRSELEARVIERTKELLEQKEKAESAARVKSDFLANMSHELRTPLNAIIGFSDMISKATIGPVDQRYREYGKHIHNAGCHLLAIVNEILDLAKLEAGEFQLREEYVDIEEVIEECRVMLIERAESAGIALTFSLEPRLPTIWADRLRFKQILLNLLTNAIKFTPSGGSVSVSVARNVGSEFVFDVSDTGIGMRGEDIRKALEPFGQVESKFGRKYDGTGLGLPLARRLVELHGGQLEIRSVPAAGTTVRITLPDIRASDGGIRQDSLAS
jgi:signal transduction histidine kinase